ncbi:hypothetical protein VE04_07627 [Pseudogymnoascus sp. 24MN13]|nr:hypothetical protein VE04_07627 [Pseudogymnoascus sp. 24MN13]
MAGEDGFQSPKRRKIDFNRLRDDDRFAIPSRPTSRSQSLAPPRSQSQAPSRSQSRFGPSSSRASTPRGQSQYPSTPKQHELAGPHDAVDIEDSIVSGALGAATTIGHVLADEMHNPFGSYDTSWEERQKEAALVEKKTAKRVTARAAQKRRDVDAWETNRMLTSGVAQRRDFGDDFEDDEEQTRVHLLIHDLRPPFLDGRT